MKIFTKLKAEFPENWDEVSELELYEDTSNILEYRYNFDSTVDVENEVGRIVRNLFEKTPKAKIRKITVHYSPRFVEDEFGGIITVSGKF